MLKSEDKPITAPVTLILFKPRSVRKRLQEDPISAFISNVAMSISGSTAIRRPPLTRATAPVACDRSTSELAPREPTLDSSRPADRIKSYLHFGESRQRIDFNPRLFTCLKKQDLSQFLHGRPVLRTLQPHETVFQIVQHAMNPLRMAGP